MKSYEHGEQGSGRPISRAKTRNAPNRNATLVGLLAIVLFSAIVSLVRITAQNFGATLGAALIYTLTSVVMWIIRRPKRQRSFPLRYLLVCGALFVVYEVSVGLAVGLAHDATQALEVSVVNYLWPTLMVLLSLIGRRLTAKTWLVIPGALLASLGTAFVVGGDAGLHPASIAAHIASSPVPYVLAFGGAIAWAVYSVITPRISEGHDGITLFLTGVAVALWIVHFLTGSVPQRTHTAGIGAYIVGTVPSQRSTVTSLNNAMLYLGLSLASGVGAPIITGVSFAAVCIMAAVAFLVATVLACSLRGHKVIKQQDRRL